MLCIVIQTEFVFLFKIPLTFIVYFFMNFIYIKNYWKISGIYGSWKHTKYSIGIFLFLIKKLFYVRKMKSFNNLKCLQYQIFLINFCFCLSIQSIFIFFSNLCVLCYSELEVPKTKHTETNNVLRFCESPW